MSAPMMPPGGGAPMGPPQQAAPGPAPGGAPGGAQGVDPQEQQVYAQIMELLVRMPGVARQVLVTLTQAMQQAQQQAQQTRASSQLYGGPTGGLG